MAVQVWIGEKPEHANERRAIVALANGLERLDGLYYILANFSVGGRAVDVVVMKQDAIFIIELKQCDGKVFGDVNGPWFVESANGVRKRLNPGRKNPYNQVISYYYSLINFLNEKRGEFLSPNKSSVIDFRTCKRVVVIAPTLQEGSQIEIDWKVELKGLDELPTYLVTERSSEIDLTEEELQQIPELLHLTRWGEVNALIAGVLPKWDAVGDEYVAPPAVVEPEPEPAPVEVAVVAEPVASEAPAPRPLVQRARVALGTWSGRAAVGFAALALLLALGYLFRTPASPQADQPVSLIVGTEGPIGGTLNSYTTASQASTNCTTSVFEWIGRKRDQASGEWQNVGVVGAPPALTPDVVVTLEDISLCNSKVTITWSMQNNMADESAIMPLTVENVLISDEDGTVYTIDAAKSKPSEIRAEPNMQAKGQIVINRPISPNTATLLITLKTAPFGKAQWPVSMTK